MKDTCTKHYRTKTHAHKCSVQSNRNVKAEWLYETENAFFDCIIISVTCGAKSKDVEMC